VHLFGTNLWHSERLIEMAKQFIQGAIMADGFFAGSNSQKVKDFVEMFEETFHEKPGFIEAVAYDTAMILFDLVSQNDIQSRSEIKNEIMNLQDFQGVTGTTSFDHTGNAHKKLYLLQICGNKRISLNSGYGIKTIPSSGRSTDGYPTTPYCKPRICIKEGILNPSRPMTSILRTH